MVKKIEIKRIRIEIKIKKIKQAFILWERREKIIIIKNLSATNYLTIANTCRHDRKASFVT